MSKSQDSGSTGRLPRITLCSVEDLDAWMSSENGEKFFGYLLAITRRRDGKLDEDRAVELLGEMYMLARRRIKAKAFYVGEQLPLDCFFYPIAALRAKTQYSRITKRTNKSVSYHDGLYESPAAERARDTQLEERLEQIVAVVNDLPEKQRLAAQLYIDFILSPPVRTGSKISIAKLTARRLAEEHRIELTPAAVEKNWQRAKIKMRDILREEGWR